MWLNPGYLLKSSLLYHEKFKKLKHLAVISSLFKKCGSFNASCDCEFINWSSKESTCWSWLCWKYSTCGKFSLMCGTCHIQNVLIGVKYWNCRQTLDFCLLFVIWMRPFQSKLIMWFFFEMCFHFQNVKGFTNVFSFFQKHNCKQK